LYWLLYLNSSLTLPSLARDGGHLTGQQKTVTSLGADPADTVIADRQIGDRKSYPTVGANGWLVSTLHLLENTHQCNRKS